MECVVDYVVNFVEWIIFMIIGEYKKMLLF